MKSTDLFPVIITCSLLVYKVKCTGSDASVEQNIKKDILVGYDRFVRPVKNLNETITVRLNPGLYCLIDVNSASQEITLKHWYRMMQIGGQVIQITVSFSRLIWILKNEMRAIFELNCIACGPFGGSLSFKRVNSASTQHYYVTKLQYWKDAFLTWNPAQYGGLSEIKISMVDVWLPDIMILSITERKQLDNQDYVVNVQSDGSVTVYNLFEVTNFPYDTQNISLTFSSWNYHANEIDLNVTSPADLTAYNENNEWTLLSYTAERVGLKSESGLFVTANYNMIIQRKPSYYISTFVWPAFIITCLSIMGVFSPFNEAGEREERVTLGLTTLLTMAVVLMIITGQMPKSSAGMPLLGIFVMAEIAISAIVTIIATIIIHLHSKWLKNESVPIFLLKVTRLPTKKSVGTSAKTTKTESTSAHSTSGSSEGTGEDEREKLRREWSRATKRLDIGLLIIFLIINSIVFAIFAMVGNSKLQSE